MQSNRLQFRRFNSSDLINLRALESDPEVMHFTSLGRALSEEQTITRLQSLLAKEQEREPLGVWAVELRDGRDFVGWFMLLKNNSETPELGFMIVKKHWGQGYATEACRVLIDYAFDIPGIQKLTATTDVANESSKRVLQKLGFHWVRLDSGLDIFEIDKASSAPGISG